MLKFDEIISKNREEFLNSLKELSQGEEFLDPEDDSLKELLLVGDVEEEHPLVSWCVEEMYHRNYSDPVFSAVHLACLLHAKNKGEEVFIEKDYPFFNEKIIFMFVPFKDEEKDKFKLLPQFVFQERGDFCLVKKRDKRNSVYFVVEKETGSIFFISDKSLKKTFREVKKYKKEEINVMKKYAVEKLGRKEEKIDWFPFKDSFSVVEGDR